jgi:hypothetical protein
MLAILIMQLPCCSLMHCAHDDAAGQCNVQNTSQKQARTTVNMCDGNSQNGGARDGGHDPQLRPDPWVSNALFPRQFLNQTQLRPALEYLFGRWYRLQDV